MLNDKCFQMLPRNFSFRMALTIFALAILMGPFPQVATAQSPDYSKIIQSRPRMFINSNTESILKNKVGTSKSPGPLWGDFEDLRTRVDNFFASGSTLGSLNSEYIVEISYALGYLYHMTGNTTYADEALEFLELEPIFSFGAEIGPAYLLESISVIYDLFFDVIVARGKKDLYTSLVVDLAEKALFYSKFGANSDYHNFHVPFVTGLLSAGIALHGEAPEAVKYLDTGRGLMATGLTMNNNWTNLNPVLYNLKESVNRTDGFSNWESPVYQRTTLPVIARAIDMWDTATGGVFDTWHTEFRLFENSGLSRIYYLFPGTLKTVPLDDSNTWGSFGGAFDWKDFRFLPAIQGKYDNPYVKFLMDGNPSTDQWHFFLVWKLLWYNPSGPSKDFSSLPLSQKMGDTYIMRSGWGSDDTFVTFKSGVYWGFHSQLDHNSFTIYKNAPLAIDSGVQDATATSPHTFNYYKRTVAHNAITVFNPQETKWWGWKKLSALSNDGGQRVVHFTRSVQGANNVSDSDGTTNRMFSIDYLDKNLADFKMGEVLRYETQADIDYIRADATKAYDSPFCGQGDNMACRVTKVEREFIYLRPNLVVVFDRVNSLDPSFQKSWLLHSTQMPSIFDSTSNAFIVPSAGATEIASNLVRIDNGAGRLFHKILLPEGNKVNVVGGPGFEFWVNNQNYPPPLAFATPDIGTARIEVQPTALQKDDLFLNVLYATDNTVSTMLETRKIVSSTSNMTGAFIGTTSLNKVILFSTTGQAPLSNITYTVSNAKKTRHYIVDLEPNSTFDINVTPSGNQNTVVISLANHFPSSTQGTLIFDVLTDGTVIDLGSPSPPTGLAFQ